jgi:hypothetical protein
MCALQDKTHGKQSRRLGSRFLTALPSFNARILKQNQTNRPYIYMLSIVCKAVVVLMLDIIPPISLRAEGDDYDNVPSAVAVVVVVSSFIAGKSLCRLSFCRRSVSFFAPFLVGGQGLVLITVQSKIYIVRTLSSPTAQDYCFVYSSGTHIPDL